MKRVMIDIETLGTTPGYAILAIGAVRFGEEDTKGEWFYRKISVADSLAQGFTYSESTLDWWIKQDEEIMTEAFSGKERLESVLTDFAAWIGEGSEVWGNGAAFDLGILSATYSRFGIKVPWDHRNERCYRTMRAFSNVGKLKILMKLIDPPAGFFSASSHNALWDAAIQARAAVLMLEANAFKPSWLAVLAKKLYRKLFY